MTDTSAAVVTAFGAPLEMWTLPLPPLERGGVLIRVDAATLCGTDAHRWAGKLNDEGGEDQPFIKPLALPYVPGHETCGTIVDTGGPVADILGRPLKAGDRIISSYPHCGHCYYCRVTRQTTLCNDNTSFGHWHPERMMGGCAEHHYFPPGGSFVRIPDQVSSPVAASATCALRTVMHGFEQLGPLASHDSVLVLGAGPLGLYALAVARERGAGAVLVIGAPSARLDVAEGWGASDTLDTDTMPDVRARVAWVKERTGGRGADVVINCANSPALTDSLRMARPGGRVVHIGVSGGADVSVPPMLFFKGIQIFSTVMAEARHFFQAIDFVASRGDRFDFARMISNTYPLARTGDALAAMAAYREVKPLVLPGMAA